MGFLEINIEGDGEQSLSSGVAFKDRPARFRCGLAIANDTQQAGALRHDQTAAWHEREVSGVGEAARNRGDRERHVVAGMYRRGGLALNPFGSSEARQHNEKSQAIRWVALQRRSLYGRGEVDDVQPH